MNERHFEVIIIGAGPAGLTAAIYASRALHRTLILEAGIPGGELLNTEDIEDYPGFISIKGPELAQKMSEQALSFGVKLAQAQVTGIYPQPQVPTRIEVEDDEPYLADIVIITAGGHPRKLDIPGELEFAGRGVSYCAVCDGAFFKGQHLAVVGGGDAALEEALFLTRYASQVTIIHRREEFRAQPVLVERAHQNGKIDFLLDTEVIEIAGNQSQVQAIHLHRKDGAKEELAVGGVFIFIGFLPNTALLQAHAAHDPQGYYLTDSNMMTSIPSIYAAGDVRSQLTRQITTAVGDATTAAIAASKYLERIKNFNHLNE